MKDLECTGCNFCGKGYAVILAVVICNAPAHAFVNNIKPHTVFVLADICAMYGRPGEHDINKMHTETFQRRMCLLAATGVKWFMVYERHDISTEACPFAVIE